MAVIALVRFLNYSMVLIPGTDSKEAHEWFLSSGTHGTEPAGCQVGAAWGRHQGCERFLRILIMIPMLDIPRRVTNA